MNYMWYKFIFFSLLFLWSFSSLAGELIQKANEIILKGQINLTKSIIINENTTVKSFSNKKVILRTKGNFPAFIVHSKRAQFENINFDGEKFIQIEKDMDLLSIKGCFIEDSKSTQKSYALTKGKNFIFINELDVSNNQFGNITPIFLNQIFVKTSNIRNNFFKNIFRYGVRIKNDSHVGQGGGGEVFNFKNNMVDGLSSGRDKKGVARLLMISVTKEVNLIENKIANIDAGSGSSNVLYWSGNAVLNVINNEISNIKGTTYAFHDKGAGLSKKSFLNNVFNQYSLHGSAGIINIHQSSNYLIEENSFNNLISSAIRISNPYPSSSGEISKNIRIVNNLFKNINFPEVISVIQSVDNLIIENNKLTGFENTKNILANNESSPRLLSLYVSSPFSSITKVALRNNKISNYTNRSSLLWISQLNNGKINGLTIVNNNMMEGGTLIKTRNKNNYILHLGNNNLGGSTSEISDNSRHTIKRINEK